MMSTKQRAEQLFNNPMAEASTNEHNQNAWLKAVEYLGTKWLLATPIQRKVK